MSANPLSPPPPSPRMLLAACAREALERMPEVVPVAGPDQRWQTGDGRQRIAGVLAVAAPGGRYELELHLAVRWPPPPLAELASAAREQVRAGARGAGLGDLLGEVLVHIEDVIEPDEAEMSAVEPAGGR